MLRSVKVRVPATSANLGPGFDCLGLALEMHNDIHFSVAAHNDLRISVTGELAGEHVPLDERNLVYRSASRIFELARRQLPGLDVCIDARTPLSRGLGGSAVAIVGGMVAANALLDEPFSQAELLFEMARLEGHPDNVVACAVGGLTASLLTNTAVVYEKFVPHASIRCVLLVPSYELPTRKARAALPRTVPIRDAIFNLSRVPLLVQRLCSGELQDLNTLMEDRLHQPFRKKLIHEYDVIVTEAERAGAAAVCLSGAGPTMIAFCTEDVSEGVSKAMLEVLRPIDAGCRAILSAPAATGAAVLDKT